MAVSQTPILRATDSLKDVYRGLANGQMEILKSYMKTAGLNVFSRKLVLANGVIITCSVTFNHEDINIYVPNDAPKITKKELKQLSGFITGFRGDAITRPYGTIGYTQSPAMQNKPYALHIDPKGAVGPLTNPSETFYGGNQDWNGTLYYFGPYSRYGVYQVGDKDESVSGFSTMTENIVTPKKVIGCSQFTANGESYYAFAYSVKSGTVIIDAISHDRLIYGIMIRNVKSGSSWVTLTPTSTVNYGTEWYPSGVYPVFFSGKGTECIQVANGMEIKMEIQIPSSASTAISKVKVTATDTYSYSTGLRTNRNVTSTISADYQTKIVNGVLTDYIVKRKFTKMDGSNSRSSEIVYTDPDQNDHPEKYPINKIRGGAWRENEVNTIVMRMITVIEGLPDIAFPFYHSEYTGKYMFSYIIYEDLRYGVMATYSYGTEIRYIYEYNDTYSNTGIIIWIDTWNGIPAVTAQYMDFNAYRKDLTIADINSNGTISWHTNTYKRPVASLTAGFKLADYLSSGFLYDIDYLVGYNGVDAAFHPQHGTAMSFIEDFSTVRNFVPASFEYIKSTATSPQDPMQHQAPFNIISKMVMLDIVPFNHEQETQ